MKKMIKIESSSFAALVRSYKKSLNMLAVLQHICQENDVALSMLPDEVCELINLDPAEIEKQRLSGRLRFAEEENGTKHYSIVDIINLKDSIDWKIINKQVENLSFEEKRMIRYFLIIDKTRLVRFNKSSISRVFIYSLKKSVLFCYLENSS